MNHRILDKARGAMIRAGEPNSVQYDAVVIGSGMSGLSSAAILAKEGMKVLVLEQHYRAGGYMHRFFRKGGIQFDVGFHYVGGVEEEQVLGAYLSYMGVYKNLNFIPLDPEGYDDVRYPGLQFMIPAGEERFKNRLLSVFPNERDGIERYFRDLRHICDNFAFYRLRVEQDISHADRWMSIAVADYLNAITRDQRLQAVLTGQNPLYGVEPSRAPMALHALVTDSFMQNPYTLEGGGDALAQTMVKQIRSLGGEVRLKRRVTEILVDDQRRVQGVRTQRGEEFRAPIVISCAHPKITLQLLPQDVLRPGYRRRVLGMEDGIPTLSVFATTRADLSRYKGHNIYNFRTYDLEGIYRDTRGGQHDFVFATVPTAREGMAKSGVHQVIGLGFMGWHKVQEWQDSETGKRGAEYEEFKMAQAHELMELIYEVIPELGGRVDSLEAATPLTNRDYAASIGGAAYGIHHSIEQSGRYGLRPRTRVGGLYMTGQSVLMPGVCGVTISAFHTCSIILGTEYLMNRVHGRDGGRLHAL